MSTPPHPVGRRSAAVYRRRRLVALLVLLMIVAGVLFLVFRPGSGGAATVGGSPATRSAAPQSSASGSPAALPGPSSSAKPAAAPSSTPKPAVAGQPCVPANVDVEAITDASSYRSGAQPLLSLSLTNTGSVMCTIDAGTATMVFTVSSGKEQYWTSTDCQSNPVHTVIKLEARQTLTSTPIPWDRSRSSKSTCDASRAAVPAGGASYHLAVSVDGIASKTSKQFLLY
jgi:zona occludens toxin (predicted ATPase)